MESLDAPAGFIDDLLDFASDIGEEEEEDDDETNKTKTLTALPFSLLSSRGAKASGIVEEEEELEWISNKDAFPMVESFVDIIPNHQPSSINNQQSPVSVLENSTSSLNSNGSNTISSGGSTATNTTLISFSSNLKVPVRARSKRRKRRRELFGGQQWQCLAKEAQKITKQRAGGAKPSSTLGRKCQHCQAEKTPQWRAGPMGPKTLCNACGVRYKSGRLVPEYRPASSPTFSTELHSNSHRKIMEMRRQNQMAREGVGLKTSV